VTALRTLIVDDHELYREGLCALLSTVEDVEVVAQASDAREAMRVAQAISPQFAIVDVSLPGSNGLALLRDLVRWDRRCKILMLTMHVSEPFVAQAFADGARGYALKDQPAPEIAEAVQTVARGQRYLAPRLPRELMDPRPEARSGDPLCALSRREREVFDLAVRGFSNDSMAREMSISVKTVETHRARINRKLGVHSTGDLVRFAATHGLISPPIQRETSSSNNTP
jgi:DNA-binding NarL/FixJ family response regulator